MKVEASCEQRNLEVVTAPTSSGRSYRLAWAAVIAIFLAIYLGSVFTPPLQDDVDSVHAEAAREMLMRHDFVTLHVSGVRYLEKAPVMYWLVAGCYRVLGVSDWATRLPTFFAMLGLVLLGAKWGSRAFGNRAGVYAGLFTATAAGCYLFTRVLIPEAILSLLIAAAFYLAVQALDRKGSVWEWYAVYALMAVAVLTKGLMAMVVIGLTLVPYLAISGEWRRWREFRLGSGLLLFFAIAAPWHILAALRNPELPTHHGFLWFYFINEHVMRFLGKRIPHDYNKQPGYLFWTLHLVWLFPWSLYLPVAVRRIRADLRKTRGERALNFESRTRLICVLWASVTLLFFSFSTNQEYYTFPAYMAFFLLLSSSVAGEELDGEDGQASGRWLLGTSIFSVTIRLIFAAVLIGGLWSSRHLPFVPDIGEVLSNTNQADYSLSMGHMLDLTGQSFAALRLPAILAVLALTVGSLFELVLRIKRKNVASTFALGFTMMVFLIAAHIALVRFDPYMGSHVIAERLEKVLQPGDHLMIYGDHSLGASLEYYLPGRVELVNGRLSSMWFGSTFPDAPKIFLEDSDLLRLWNSEARVYLFVPQEQRAKVLALLHDPQVFTESSGKMVYVNH